MSVLVVGSFMIDFVVRTSRAPQAGETIVGIDCNKYFGGKGANQAATISNLGTNVYMAGMLGNDNFGLEFYKKMKELNVNVDNVKFTDKVSSGVGNITIEENGQNRIIIVPGANLEYQVSDLLEIESLIEKVDIVVTQLEMQYDIVKELAKLCHKHNKKFILNPAPARTIDDETLKNVTFITPNETELAILTGKTLNSIDDYKEGAKILLSKGVKNVIVTLGDKGVLYVNEKEEVLIPALKVNVVDTTAAGDSFTGAFAAFLSMNKEIKEALELANVVGSLTVQKKGAIPSLPHKEDVERVINRKLQ